MHLRSANLQFPCYLEVFVILCASGKLLKSLALGCMFAELATAWDSLLSDEEYLDFVNQVTHNAVHMDVHVSLSLPVILALTERFVLFPHFVGKVPRYKFTFGLWSIL